MHNLQAPPSQKRCPPWCRGAFPQPGPWLGPSPLLSGGGPERWRQAGGVVLPTVNSQKVVLGSHLYPPMMDLLHACVCVQCPKRRLLCLAPSCHVGHTGLCLSSSITPSSILCPWLLLRNKNKPWKRDKTPF